jgi:outer membrane receptor for ferric coprogen and ferric-rhodotorulic acid
MYAVPAHIVSGLEVGAGLRSMSSFYSQSGKIKIRAPGYTVASLTVGYRISRNLKLALNVDNLFDKRYWEKVSGTSRQNFYGAPRSVSVSLRGTF